MHDSDATQVKRVRVLQEVYGREVGLVADSGNEELYRIAAEFQLGSNLYAALQTSAMKKEDELAFFRIIQLEDGEYTLESLDDEDEWEEAAEAYDELLFEEAAK
ncbi:DUF1292 domain-containing protein [Paenibacillus sp. GCM10012307]|uniref:DUF1292 domain-containing protein n=1 Tax=Paenibacillus roseus TaxID=2798579 RepID=A0A934J491_9BACL|nr:DUF1292 domain-containing protein [Paenibacillus roseus]MBJ6362999.1 DUF1292 domain-containing protein [Paenibacillus roseus]